MSLNGVPTTLVVKEEQFLKALKDALIENGSSLDWVSDNCERAIVSLSAYIQVDVLGGLSDFNDQYPNATSLTKARILKEFLGKERNNRGVYTENDTQYPIDEITETLQTYINDSHAFDDALDKQLIREKLAGRVSMFTHLNDTRIVFSALCHVTLLQTMQRFLDESEQKDEQLQQWINTEKEKCFDKEITQSTKRRSKIFRNTLGYYDFNSFFQGEYENLRLLIRVLKYSFTRSSLQAINLSVGGIALRLLMSFLLSALFLSRFGKMALFPQRFFFTVMRVGINASGKFLRKLLSFIIDPNGRAANGIIRTFLLTSWCAALLLSGLYFGVNLSYLLGIQFFPTSWRASSIYMGYIIYAGMDFSSYLAFKGVDMIGNLATSIRSFFRRGNNERNQENNQQNNTDAEIMLQQNNIGVEITLQQRRSLIALLMTERPTQSQENKRTINQELAELSNTDKPYYLSELDKVLIENKNRGDEFGLTTNAESVEVQALPLPEMQRSALNDRQRLILARLLILNRNEEVLQGDQALISTELNDLGYRSTPYYLSTLDRKVISREKRQAEFALADAEAPCEEQASSSPSL